MKYTRAEDYPQNKVRPIYEGSEITVTKDCVKVGDLISTGRVDKNSLLPIFFKIDKIGVWGVHDNAFTTHDEGFCLAPDNFSDSFIIIRDY